MGNKTKTKKDLIQDVSRQCGVSPTTARTVIQGFIDCSKKHLESEEGNRIELRGFGVFEAITRKKKIGRNPKNASVPIIIPPFTTIKFTPGKSLKESLKGP